MPCYEQPPDYVGKERENAEEAVKILCHLVTQAINGGVGSSLPTTMLKWYINHRKIDQEILQARDKQNSKDFFAASQDIESALKIISNRK